MAGALASVRVLDAATLYPGPLLAAMLGDLGADVVKIEPTAGDPLRTMGDAPFAVANRNKRSIVANLDAPDGVALLQRLTAAADVIVLNQPAAVLERWSCTDDEIHARNRRTVVVHVSAFGTTGPYAARVGNGSLAEAFVGLEPSRVALGDTVGALSGVIGVVSALYERDTASGNRRTVDVSLYEALLPLLGPALAGATRPRSIRETFTTLDGRTVMVAATTDAQIDRLHALAGHDRATWIGARTAVDAVAALVATRVPAVVVNDLPDLRADPHVVARASITIAGTAPGLGEHTDEVVEEWLGGSE